MLRRNGIPRRQIDIIDNFFGILRTGEQIAGNGLQVAAVFLSVSEIAPSDREMYSATICVSSKRFIPFVRKVLTPI